MTVLTPELIEKAAEAIELAMWNEPSSEALARAALQAVLPDLVEKCAKEADDGATHANTLEGDRAGLAAAMARDIAVNIRSLLNKEDNANG